MRYNHHHNAYVLGKNAEIVYVGPHGSKVVPMHGGLPSKWEPRAIGESLIEIDGKEIPTSAFVVDGNGTHFLNSFRIKFSSVNSHPCRVKAVMIDCVKAMEICLTFLNFFHYRYVCSFLC